LRGKKLPSLSKKVVKTFLQRLKTNFTQPRESSSPLSALKTSLPLAYLSLR